MLIAFCKGTLFCQPYYCFSKIQVIKDDSVFRNSINYRDELSNSELFKILNDSSQSISLFTEEDGLAMIENDKLILCSYDEPSQYKIIEMDGTIIKFLTGENDTTFAQILDSTNNLSRRYLLEPIFQTNYKYNLSKPKSELPIIKISSPFSEIIIEPSSQNKGGFLSFKYDSIEIKSSYNLYFGSRLNNLFLYSLSLDDFSLPWIIDKKGIIYSSNPNTTYELIPPIEKAKVRDIETAIIGKWSVDHIDIVIYDTLKSVSNKIDTTLTWVQVDRMISIDKNLYLDEFELDSVSGEYVPVSSGTYFRGNLEVSKSGNYLLISYAYGTVKHGWGYIINDDLLIMSYYDDKPNRTYKWVHTFKKRP